MTKVIYKEKIKEAWSTFGDCVWLRGVGYVPIKDIKILETDWVDELEKRLFS
jgi:hypothetical protein